MNRDHSRQHIKKQRQYFVYKGLSSQDYDFACGYVWMWELDYKKKNVNADELILLNSGFGEDSWELLGQQEDPTSLS